MKLRHLLGDLEECSRILLGVKKEIEEDQSAEVRSLLADLIQLAYSQGDQSRGLPISDAIEAVRRWPGGLVVSVTFHPPGDQPPDPGQAFTALGIKKNDPERFQRLKLSFHKRTLLALKGAKDGKR